MVQKEGGSRAYSRDKWLLGLLVFSVIAFVIVRVLLLIKGTGAF